MTYDGLLINTCTIKIQNFDKWGDLLSTALVPNQPCRFMHIHKTIRDFKGEERVSAGKFFLKKVAVIDHEDLILYESVDYSILKINRPQDSVNLHHIEVWVT